MALYNPSMQSLGTFLSNHYYRIPDYQREYSWDKLDQVSDFWEDLCSLVNERKLNKISTHFFGQAVIHHDKINDTFNLIDGQQRITTSVIALAVMRDKFKEISSVIDDAEEEYNDIKSLYIGRYKETTGEDKLKFRLGESDRLFFRNNIQLRSPKQKAESPAQKRIVEAYNFLLEKITEQLDNETDDASKYSYLESVFESLKDGFQLLTLMTDDINEAFVIFETLNARGKDLETADLLKNYFFMMSNGSSANIVQIKDLWQEMTSTLEKKEDTTKLIRYYWNSTRKYVHDKQLYKDISHNVKVYNDCLSIVKDLVKVADLYNTLSNPTENDYFGDKFINKKLKNLQIMKVTTFYPVVIAMVLKGMSNNDIGKVISSLEVMAFRNFSIAGMNPNRIEKILATMALGITNDKVKVDDAVKKIKEQTTKDDEIKLKMQQLKPTVNVAKFILREIENHISGASEKEVIDDNKAINLEHIMPQNNTIWLYPAEDHKELYPLIGNMTLLLERFNKSISNNVFDEKKKKYKDSAINLTKELCKYPKWDKQTINSRSEYLAQQVLEIWPL